MAQQIAAEDVTETLTTALAEWNWTDDLLQQWADDLSRDQNRTLVIVEDWFARKELSGIEALYGQIEHETDDAVLVKQAGDFTERNERQGHFQTHITEAWVPKSVIKGEI